MASPPRCVQLGAAHNGYCLGLLFSSPCEAIALDISFEIHCFAVFFSFQSVIHSLHNHSKATRHSLQFHSIFTLSHHARSILGFGGARCWVGECLAISQLRKLSSWPRSKVKADILIRVRTRTTVIETSLTLALLVKRISSAWSIFRVQPPRHLRSQRTSIIAMAMLLPSALHALASPIL
jgi:hypothetical protein